MKQGLGWWVVLAHTWMAFPAQAEMEIRSTPFNFGVRDQVELIDWTIALKPGQGQDQSPVILLPGALMAAESFDLNLGNSAQPSLVKMLVDRGIPTYGISRPDTHLKRPHLTSTQWDAEDVPTSKDWGMLGMGERLNHAISWIEGLHPGKKPKLVGLSLGGMLAIYLVNQYPDRFESLALLDSTLMLDPSVRGEGFESSCEQFEDLVQDEEYLYYSDVKWTAGMMVPFSILQPQPELLTPYFDKKLLGIPSFLASINRAGLKILPQELAAFGSQFRYYDFDQPNPPSDPLNLLKLREQFNLVEVSPLVRDFLCSFEGKAGYDFGANLKDFTGRVRAFTAEKGFGKASVDLQLSRFELAKSRGWVTHTVLPRYGHGDFLISSTLRDDLYAPLVVWLR